MSSSRRSWLRDQTSAMRSPTALAVRPIPRHMSIHHSDYLWTAHGHSCVVIMAAVAPKSLLRELRSSPHCGSLRDQTSVMRSPTALAVRPIPWHMSIHDSDYLWTAHGHSCVVIMAAVAPKSLLREVRPIPWHMSIYTTGTVRTAALSFVYIYSSCRLPQPPYVRPLRQPPRRRPPQSRYSVLYL